MAPMWLYLTFVINFLTFAFCYEPFSTFAYLTGGVVLSGTYAVWNYAHCKFEECCDDYWINYNVSLLEDSLKHNLYGQHLVSQVIPKVIRAYFLHKGHKKALTLSFHGPTGTGKNYVSKIIAESMYRNGFKSKFVHLYIANKDFPHAKEIAKYQDRLRNEIESFTKLCGRSLFIFDEVDKMPSGMLDAIKPYLDYHDDVNGVDYRNNIFVFLSNDGGSKITEVALNFWAEGQERESITLKHVESSLNTNTLNERGGLQYSGVVGNELIDIYLPFFPLEKKHVRDCIASELKARKLRYFPDIVEKVANEIDYFPPKVNLFSKSGCKKISNKIDIYVEIEGIRGIENL